MVSLALVETEFEDDGDAVRIDDADALEEAACRLRRKDYKEALYQLSKALGRDFDALATLRPEDIQ